MGVPRSFELVPTSPLPRGAAVGPALLALVALAGCVAQRYALPMTADEQRAHQEGAALVAYLGQPGASGGVCDPRSGPSALLRDGDAAAVLVGALVRGQVPVEPWGRCVADWLAGAGPVGSTALLESILVAALSEIESTALDLDAARATRLDALIAAYAGRPPGRDAGSSTVDRVTGALVDCLAIGPDIRAGPQHERLRQPLAPGARARALALAQAIDPVKGLGQPVDAPLLDRLEAGGDESTLRQLAARLPDEGLRTEARRKVVRLHVAATTWPEVRGDAAAVEAAVLRTGTNAVALEAHPVRRAWLEPPGQPEVLVEQRPAEGLARLLAVPRAGGIQALVPERPLRGWLRFDLAGLSAPVTLCAPPVELEVAPCLPPGAVAVAGTLATLDAAGRLHLRERLTQREVVALARGGSRLEVPLLLAGRPIATAAWPLAFAAPPELAFAGAEGGGPGPALSVQVEALPGGVLVFQVSDGAGTFDAVVERAGTPFRVVSRGGRGSPGRGGWSGGSGSDGRDGSDATCPSMSGSDGGRGGDGSDGQDGGGGGPGGPGGDVEVTLVGGGADRPALLERLRWMVASEGGAGGPGGRGGDGGAGGRGGRGGTPASCTSADGTTTTLSGGSSGSSGSSGRGGRDGPAGRPGLAGVVTFGGGP